MYETGHDVETLFRFQCYAANIVLKYRLNFNLQEFSSECVTKIKFSYFSTKTYVVGT